MADEILFGQKEELKFQNVKIEEAYVLLRILRGDLHHRDTLLQEVQQRMRRIEKLEEAISEASRLAQEFVYFPVTSGGSTLEHWVVEKQEHYFELFVGNNNKPVFSLKRKGSDSNRVANIARGYTFLSVQDIRVIGERIMSEKYQDYNLLFNNCQQFANDLLGESISKDPYGKIIHTGSGATGSGAVGSKIDIGGYTYIYDRIKGIVVDTKV